jgi:hypothetical protein
MNLTLKLAVSTALLTVAAVSAQAQVAVPSIPGSYPTDTSLSPTSANPTPGNGAVLVQAFDPLTGHSLTEWLGLNYNDFQPSNAVSAAGGTSDFGIIGGSALWNATFGGDTNPIDFSVTSANNAVSGATSILTTLSAAPTTLKNNAIGNAAAKFASAIGVLTAGQQSTSGQAASANPAQTLATTDNGYLVVNNIGAQFGNSIGENIFGVAGGSAVGFYKYTQTSTSSFTAGTVQTYANASFSLSSAGDLVYTVTGTGGGTPVPLPAAVWLLGSGLMGLFGIGRRRAASAVVAA